MAGIMARVAPSLKPRSKRPGGQHKKRITGVQLFNLFRRVAGVAAALMYAGIGLQAAYKTVGVLQRKEVGTQSFGTLDAELIVLYAGNGLIRDSPIVQEVLGDDTTPRNQTLYLQSPTTTSFENCGDVGTFNADIYSESFLYTGFLGLVATSSYNITILQDIEFIMPVVDCTSPPLVADDPSLLRVFNLVRSKTDPEDVRLVAVALSAQDYRIEEQNRLGPAVLSTIFSVSDMRATKVEQFFVLGLDYPYTSSPAFDVYTLDGVSPNGYWEMSSVPRNISEDPIKHTRTARRRGFYLHAESEQANLRNLYWAVETESPARALSEWKWYGEPILLDSWAWVHGIHLLFAWQTLFSLGVLSIVVFRNLRMGKIWIGDAFASVSNGTLMMRGFLVLASWRVNEYWTLLEFCLSNANTISGIQQVPMHQELSHADLMVMFLSIIGLIGRFTKERIDPAFALFLFEVIHSNRLHIIKASKPITKAVVDYANSEYRLGIASVTDAQRKLSAMRLWTTHMLDDQQEKKVTGRTADRSADEKAALALKGNLTNFEISTGAELEARYGLISDYKNYVFFKGLKFASADGVYCSGYVVANGKFLVGSKDLLSIIMIKAFRSRFTNVYVYAVDGNTVQRTAQLLQEHASYNLSYVTELELIAPIVDCTFDLLVWGDRTLARVYYLTRRKNDPTDLILLSTSLSAQDYEVDQHFQKGPALVLLIAAIDDMSATTVDHHIAIALNYPYVAEPVFEYSELEGIDTDSYWLLTTLANQRNLDPAKDVRVARRFGRYVSDLTAQSNVEVTHLGLPSDPASELGEWRWHSRAVLHDSWAWTHAIHGVYAINVIFNLGVLAFVIYQRLRKGHLWVGDAFSTISNMLLYRGLLVLVCNHLNGYWTVTKMCISIGDSITDLHVIYYKPELVHADLLSVFMNLVSGLTYLGRERVDPLVAFATFELSWAYRLNLAKLFPRLRETIENFALADTTQGLLNVSPGLANLSPMELMTAYRVVSDRTPVVLSAVVSIFSPIVLIAAYIVARKAVRFIEFSDGGSVRFGRPRAKVYNKGEQQTDLTSFEAATGAALSKRHSLSHPHSTLQLLTAAEEESQWSHLITGYAGTTTIRESSLVLDILGGSTDPRNDSVYLETATAQSFTGCSDVPKFDAKIYSNQYMRLIFSKLQAHASYNLSYIKELELIAPVVDCMFDLLVSGDRTVARVYYLTRSKSDPTQVLLLSASLSAQDYVVDQQFQKGSAMMLLIAAIDDMRATTLDHQIAIALNYPYVSEPAFAYAELDGVDGDNYWILKMLSDQQNLDPTKIVRVARRFGRYIRDPTAQSNIETAHWDIPNNPTAELGEWRWFSRAVLHDSWAWTHAIHGVFAIDVIFNLSILSFVIYRRLRLGHIWVGDAFSTISSTLLYRGILVIVCNELNGFWTITKMCTSIGDTISDLHVIFYKPELVHADLLAVYLCLTTVLSYLTRERVDPLLAFATFELGWGYRVELADFFPVLRKHIRSFAIADTTNGLLDTSPGLAKLSPMKLLTAYLFQMNRAPLVSSMVISIFSPIVLVLAYIVAQKITRYEDRPSAHGMGRRRSSGYKAGLQQIDLTSFEAATGSALRKRYGVVSGYENYIVRNKQVLATIDAIYGNGFLVANGKFLVATQDLIPLVLMKLSHIRFANIFVYEIIKGSAVKETSRLVYPTTLSWNDLMHLDIIALA
ncbi:hypothetical protein BBO99_00008458 [Phytophthora kernoviae]|uniref:Uncharacterized protein n=1 Tax=Phytophthora kernoviae TaxID=325452 RepID=A0A421F9R8_9STRA|nr:hypothetical protein JM16_008202 [Phytophthora kernoviae]KAG2514562.1 hypothetical protein JM18_008318 [Phytophthora kernoviae]RLN32093.1 hypothetical protein BBI17_008397 [Phytophthora kernoviae]RLN75274.1 hypothetical protein BBO99_00008458 [Phytophthora kernoviae]